jgi:hypothetical protein
MFLHLELSYAPILGSEVAFGPYRVSARQSQILEFLSRREFLSLAGHSAAGPTRVRDGDVISRAFPCYDPNPSPAELNALDGPALVTEILAKFQSIVRSDGGLFRVLLIPEYSELETGTMSTHHASLVQLLKSKGIPVTDLVQREGVQEELIIDGKPWVWAPCSHLSARASEIAAERILQDLLRDKQL